jgi:hypothetical protein
MEFRLRDFQLSSGSMVKDLKDVKAGFLLKHSEADAGGFLDDAVIDTKDCTALLEDEENFFRIEAKDMDKKIEIIGDRAEGFYSLIYYNCEPLTTASFVLELENYNPGPNYLSAGYTPLPTIYTLLCFVYLGVLLLWVFYFMRGEGKRVFHIHHLMTVLICLKLLSLVFEAIEFHYKKTTGHPGGWAIAYYVFAGLKGITMFVVIALIGTGWAFIKPFLSEKDKKIFLVVIPLQILSNVAMAIIEETAPGDQGFVIWKEIFRLVDIVCCGAILVPIIWSIKHLRDAAQIDGKAKRNMEKLKLFREFYLLVVTYIYFTRIIVFLLDATLPFTLVWLGEFFTEVATLIFWGVTGYKFRPVPDNPYLSLEEEEAAEKEAKEALQMEELDTKDPSIN